MVGSGRRSAGQLQVLRNQRVGRTWSGAASGPRLTAVIRIAMSSSSTFAYSTVMSKNRSSSKMPVSSSSYSGPCPPRRRARF
jgi:hypothetical protein